MIAKKRPLDKKRFEAIALWRDGFEALVLVPFANETAPETIDVAGVAFRRLKNKRGSSWVYRERAGGRGTSKRPEG